MTNRCGSLLTSALAVLIILATAAPVEAGNHILYMHGRSHSGTPSYALFDHLGGWEHHTFTYNGSSRLGDSGVRSQVNGAMATYCRGTNSCVVACYSAGCARAKLAFSDLAAAGTPASNVLWVENIASVAGGTELANYTSKWYLKLIARIFGYYAAIDNDIKPSVMRGSYGYIQNSTPAPAYDLAGNGNICVRFLIFFKLCGNERMPGGNGDGAVPVHSACGYADAGSHGSCCDGSAKYTNHNADQCATHPRNHTGMYAIGTWRGSVRMGTTYQPTPDDAWAGDTRPNVDCALDDCDAQSTEPSLAGVLNVTNLAVGNVALMDNCNTCNPSTGCSQCAAFSVYHSGYAPTAWASCDKNSCSNYVCDKAGCRWI